MQQVLLEQFFHAFPDVANELARLGLYDQFIDSRVNGLQPADIAETPTFDLAPQILTEVAYPLRQVPVLVGREGYDSC
jgi:hypothetical protein